MEKYQRGKIYKIVSPNTDRIYIGSTTQKTLALRMADHRRDHIEWQAGRCAFIGSFEMIEYGDAAIILLESYSCANRDELRACEQKHLDANPGVCTNKLRARTTPEESRAQQNTLMICPCGGQHTVVNTAKHNRTELHKRYLTGEPAPLPTYNRNELIICDCGVLYKLGQLTSHNKTKRHQRYLAGDPIPEPCNKKEPVICDCGGRISCDPRRHARTNKHIAYLAGLEAAAQVEVQ